VHLPWEAEEDCVVVSQAKGLKRKEGAGVAMSGDPPQRRARQRNGGAPKSTGGIIAGAVNALASASCRR